MKPLREILQSLPSSDLDCYLDPPSWKTLSEEERALLAQSLNLRGKILLKKGKANALQFFQRAYELQPTSPQILFTQAQAFAEQSENHRCQERALTLLSQLKKVGKEDFEVWKLFAQVKRNLGAFHGNLNYYQEACHYFKKAEAVAGKKEKPSLIWLYAVCCYEMGMLSGEAVDHHTALDKFRQVEKVFSKDPQFLYDRGRAFCELGHLLDQEEFFYEAIDDFQKAVDNKRDFAEAGLMLAVAYSLLFKSTLSEQHFSLAERHFEQVAKLQEDSWELFLYWGTLLVSYGRTYSNAEKLQASFLKFARAEAMEINTSTVLVHWADAEIECGILTDNLDLLKKGQKHAQKALALSPKDSYIWRIWAESFRAIGNYFSDEEYLFQAVEKFQSALSLHPTSATLHFELATTYYDLGILLENSEMLIKSEEEMKRAYELRSEGPLSVAFWQNWGQISMKLAELTGESDYTKTALKYFEQAIHLHVKSEPKQLADPELYYDYGLTLEDLGALYQDERYLEKAVKAFSYSLKLKPNQPPVIHSLAMCLFQLATFVGEIEYFRKALYCFKLSAQFDLENDGIWCDWGFVLIHLAEMIKDPTNREETMLLMQEAEEKLMRAVSLGSLDALYWLAGFHSLNHNMPASLAYLKRVAATDALPTYEEMMRDDWLESLRKTKEFSSFASDFLSQEEQENS